MGFEFLDRCLWLPYRTVFCMENMVLCETAQKHIFLGAYNEHLLHYYFTPFVRAANSANFEINGLANIFFPRIG